jgi:hypothetical protein
MLWYNIYVLEVNIMINVSINGQYKTRAVSGIQGSFSQMALTGVKKKGLINFGTFFERNN